MKKIQILVALSLILYSMSDSLAYMDEEVPISPEENISDSESGKERILQSGFQYDFFVIGGGSGGLSASKEAAKFGKKVGLADFVKPSPKGTTWGLGGTCVNVGCIPKKMMHFAGNLYENFHYFPFVGYPVQLLSGHNWETLVGNVQDHIHGLNFGYRTVLRTKGVTFYNKLAKLVDRHTIELTDARGNKETVTAETILVAVGGRPHYGDIPGAKEACITSDDLFSLQTVPGKTLIVGASYIALETSGFLHALGYDTTVMVRSTLLQKFDPDIVKKIETYLVRHGLKFLKPCSPTKFTKRSDGKIVVDYENTDTKQKFQDVLDTCLIAVGRSPDTVNLGLDKAGVQVTKNGKLIVNDAEQTNIPNIYSIGDCAEGRPELTPPAIMAGKLLARRLYGGSKQLMDYNNVATTLYTPLEYGTVGYGQEDAKKKFGEANIKAYHVEFTPLEWTFDNTGEDTCYIKVVINTADKNRVIGFHILAPNAGEITQGIAVAMKTGITKEQLDNTVGIHPTIAEEFTTLEVTTEEGDGKKGGC